MNKINFLIIIVLSIGLAWTKTVYSQDLYGQDQTTYIEISELNIPHQTLELKGAEITHQNGKIKSIQIIDFSSDIEVEPLLEVDYE